MDHRGCADFIYEIWIQIWIIIINRCVFPLIWLGDIGRLVHSTSKQSKHEPQWKHFDCSSSKSRRTRTKDLVVVRNSNKTILDLVGVRTPNVRTRQQKKLMLQASRVPTTQWARECGKTKFSSHPACIFSFPGQPKDWLFLHPASRQFSCSTTL